MASTRTPIERPTDKHALKRASLESFVSWWVGSCDANRLRHRFLAGLLIGVCLAVAVVGVPLLQIFGHDLFVSLDGGWRVLHGQRPGVDFYSQMGPAYYLLHATGLWLAGGDARGLGYGSALAAALISFWAFFLLQSRMKPAPFFVTCLFIALLVAAPFPLGYPHFQATFSMKHNRYGFALTALVILESFLPQEDSTRKRRFLGGFSTGLACALLLFLKISYGFVALTIAAISLPVCSGTSRRLAGITAGFAAFTVPMMAYLRFDLLSQVHQYQWLAKAQGHKLSLHTVLYRLSENQLEIALVVLMAALVSLLPGVSLRRGLTLMLTVAMAIVAGTLLMLTNTQPSGMPLLQAAVLLLLNEITAAIPETSALPQTAPLLAVGLLVLVFPMCNDAAGIAIAMKHKVFPVVRSYRFQEPKLASISFADCPSSIPEDGCWPTDNGQYFVQHTEEGIALIQANGRPGESVVGMGMSNPFSFATQRPPAHGGAVVLSATNISPSAMPPKSLLIGDAALLLVPKYWATERDTLAAIRESYPELLGTEYLQVAESENWVLYRRASQESQKQSPLQ